MSDLFVVKVFRLYLRVHCALGKYRSRMLSISKVPLLDYLKASIFIIGS